MTTFADDGHYGEALALAHEAGWTDGLPVALPTAERVRELVEASGRSALELVGEAPPRRAYRMQLITSRRSTVLGCPRVVSGGNSGSRTSH